MLALRSELPGCSLLLLGDIHRVSENVEECFPKRPRIFYVGNDIDVLMKIYLYRIMFALDAMRDPVDRFFFFRLKSAEHPVPEGKGRAKIFVDVFLLGAMMYAMT